MKSTIHALASRVHNGREKGFHPGGKWFSALESRGRSDSPFPQISVMIIFSR